jgi:hypothetical protein
MLIWGRLYAGPFFYALKSLRPVFSRTCVPKHFSAQARITVDKRRYINKKVSRKERKERKEYQTDI